MSYEWTTHILRGEGLQDFRNLEVWKRSHSLTLELYRVTSKFPSNELYGMTSQIRRAAASVPANIAEGCGRYGNAELTRFLRIAIGSSSELEYHVLLAYDLGYIGKEEYEELTVRVVEVRRMLIGLSNRTRTDR